MKKIALFILFIGLVGVVANYTTKQSNKAFEDYAKNQKKYNKEFYNNH